VWAREIDARAIALRYHNVYGPGMPRDTPYSGVASTVRSSLEARRATDFAHAPLRSADVG
jgi:dTDP-L-rhamnose 4-epimerase